MKKTYIEPSTRVMTLNVHKMICVSSPDVMINSSGIVEAGEVESRRSSIWGDDEEE